MSENEVLPATKEIVPQDTGELIAVTREQAEIQSALILAKKFPRDELAAEHKILKDCESFECADRAVYSYPRGGATVEGPSVDLARSAAKRWGNIRYGFIVVGITEEEAHIRGYAIDLETNTYVETQDKFKALVYRKQGGWVKPDERDLRELVNKRGAICERNAILKLLPGGLVERAKNKAKETLKKAASGTLKANREDAIRKLLSAFQAIGVTPELLKGKLGHELELINEDELVELRGVYKSITDGHTKRSDHFEFADSAVEQSGKTKILNEQLRSAVQVNLDQITKLKAEVESGKAKTK